MYHTLYSFHDTPRKVHIHTFVYCTHTPVIYNVYLQAHSAHRFVMGKIQTDNNNDNDSNVQKLTTIGTFIEYMHIQ